jgi:hypothetical protein
LETYGSIKLVDILLGVQKSDSVESLDLLVAAQMNILAHGVRILQVRQKLLDEQI